MLRTNGPAALHRHGRLRFGKDCRVRPRSPGDWRLPRSASAAPMRSRLDVRLDPAFVASIKDLGVLVPIMAVRTAEGAVRVRLGNRRTLGAIEAGRPTVPMLV